MSGPSQPSKPAYHFNPNLHINTIDPPVQIGARWAQSYPSASSPFRSSSLQGEFPMLNLAQGVPGHPPTQEFLERIQFESRPENASSPAGHSHGYGPVFGDPKLRQAVARDINRVYRTPGTGSTNQVTEDNVGITAGCNLAFAAVAQSIAAPGDALIVLDPWYFNHQMTLSSYGIQIVSANTVPPHYMPDVKWIRALLSADSKSSTKTIKGVILVTPNNPTGAIYPSEVIRDVALLCREYKVALILDETYRDFLLTGKDDDDDQNFGTSSHTGTSSLLPFNFARPHHLFEDAPQGIDSDWDWRSTLIHLFSFSKSYAIPGHRLGGFVAHPAFLQQKVRDERGREKISFGPMAKALDNFQVAPPRTDTQRAVAWAIEDPQQLEWRNRVANELRIRRKAFIQGLSRKVPCYLNQDGSAVASTPSGPEKSPAEWGWQVESAGAYYVFLKHPFDSLLPERVAQGLAELVGVVVLPGSFFMPKHMVGSPHSAASRLRISIANVSNEKLAKLPERLAILSELWQKKGHGWGLSS